MLVEIIGNGKCIDTYGNEHKFISNENFLIGEFIEAEIEDGVLVNYCQTNKRKDTFNFVTTYNGVSVGITEDGKVVIAKQFLDVNEAVELIVRDEIKKLCFIEEY